MPPKKKSYPKKQWNEHKCCNIWFNDNGKLGIGCAHCWKSQKSIDVSETYDPEYLQIQIERVKASHKRLCQKGKNVR